LLVRSAGFERLGVRARSELNSWFNFAREAAQRGIPRIQHSMSQARLFRHEKNFSLVWPASVFMVVCAAQGPPLKAQAGQQGPIAPPPEHHVTRIITGPEPEAPPALPEVEITKRFSLKEDQYILSLTGYTYRKTIRIQEFGPDGQPAGEFVLVTQPARDVDGKMFEKVIEKPQSTLQHLFLRSEDLAGLQRIPSFALTSSQLAKYDLKYVGKEQVDEVDCYLFQVKPKMVERLKAYFDGVVWVDAKYLEVVKTYGKWANDQGELHPMAALPFSLFETYREYVDGKYWFPNYSRSDATLTLKEQEIPVRIVIKWTDFKAVSGAPPAVAAPAATTSPNP
jgi:hypothetical protein